MLRIRQTVNRRDYNCWYGSFLRNVLYFCRCGSLFKTYYMKALKVCGVRGIRICFMCVALLAVSPMCAMKLMDAGKPTEKTVEVMPRFPGGEKACIDYVAGHLVYPELAKKNGVMGRVMVQFTVATDGSLQDVKVVKKKVAVKAKPGNTDAVSGASAQVSPEEAARWKAVKEKCGWLLEEEALRIVRGMPKWEPGTQNGKAVCVKYVLPVKFTL